MLRQKTGGSTIFEQFARNLRLITGWRKGVHASYDPARANKFPRISVLAAVVSVLHEGDGLCHERFQLAEVNIRQPLDIQA